MAIGKIAPVAPPTVAHGTLIVKILVGPENEENEENKEYMVHKDLLCATSQFFTAALDGNFKEAHEQTIKLPEEDPSRFQLFYDWLYSGRVVEGPQVYMTEETQTYSDDFWLDIYLMAERLIIPGLQKLACHRLRELFSHHIPLVPSHVFAATVFEQNSEPLKWLEKYLAGHVCYWLPKTKDPKIWEDLIGVNHRFGAVVGQVLVSQMYLPKDNVEHPAEDINKWRGDDETWKMPAGGEAKKKKPFPCKLLESATLIVSGAENAPDEWVSDQDSWGWYGDLNELEAYIKTQEDRQMLDAQDEEEKQKRAAAVRDRCFGINMATYRELGTYFAQLAFGISQDALTEGDIQLGPDALWYLLEVIAKMRSLHEES